MPEPAKPSKTRQDLSLDQIREAVQRALVGATPAGSPVPYTCQVYPDRVIIEVGGAYFERAYTMGEDGVVTLGESKQVEPAFVPVKQGMVALFANGTVRQAVSPREFDICVIREGFAVGTGKDGRYYRDGRPLHWARQAIESAVEVYEGAPVTAFRFGDAFAHLPDGPDRMKALATLNTIGRLSSVRVEQGADGKAELRARLVLADGVDPVVPAVLAEWADESIPMTQRGGFSIEAVADFQSAIVDGVAVTQGIAIRRNPDGPSLDMVSHPAAGGRVLKVAASIHGGEPMPDPKKQDDATTTAVLDDAKKVTQSATDALARLAEKEKALNIREAADKVRQACTAASLPDAQAALVIDHFAGREEVPDADLKAKVEQAQKALQTVGVVSMPGTANIQVGAEPRDKMNLGLEALMTRSSAPAWVRKDESGKTIEERCRQAGVDHTVARASLLRFFREAHGFTRNLEDGFIPGRRESIKQAITTTQWGDAWQNVLDRLGVRWFENPDFSDWKKVCVTRSVKDFNTQERFVKGGYPNLAVVAEGANYAAMTSPGDEGQSYTPQKRGGTETLTREAILRDDVAAIADIPMLMGTAAIRTLYEFVFDRLDPAGTDTVDYDGELVVDTDHDINNNKGTTAFAAAELIVAVKAMQAFRDISVNKRLGVIPRYVLHPLELGNTVYDVLKPGGDYPGGSTTDNAWIRKQALEGIWVRHWTDATNWALVADPSLHPWNEVAFVQGQETPAFFEQNNESFGSVFDRDAITYKIRHEYGGKVLRHEFIYGEVVAG